MKKAQANREEKQDEQMNSTRIYGRLHRLLARFFLRLFRVRVHFAEREPADTHYLLCCNHISAVDPILLAAASHRQQPRFMAKKELFKIPLLAGLIRTLGAFPVDRTGDVGAIKTSVSLLESGKCVGIFPQGTRCPGKAPRETADRVKNGAGLLVCKTGVSVLPVCLKTKKNKLLLFRRVDLIIGEPIPYEVLTESIDPSAMTHQALYSHVSRVVFEHICALYEEVEEQNG
jgi:1-acyl-sn-glycerol-3-phosphate acyltransferase